MYILRGLALLKQYGGSTDVLIVNSSKQTRICFFVTLANNL